MIHLIQHAAVPAFRDHILARDAKVDFTRGDVLRDVVSWQKHKLDRHSVAQRNVEAGQACVVKLSALFEEKKL